MQRIGIIAEFNPLHLGHKYLIDTAKAEGEAVCAISSNFVQRGDTALCEKRVRTQMALNCGADLVLEIPVCYSMSTAQNFALGGVSALLSVGCDTLMFGSEVGEIEPLLKTAGILDTTAFKEKLSQNLINGTTFAKARQISAEQCGAPKGILSGANNSLAIEYILAAKSLGAKMQFKTVKRQGVFHDDNATKEGFASASLLRENILNGNFDFAKIYMPKHSFELLSNISDIKLIENAILAILRTKNIEDLKQLPDISEGLENKLFSAIKTATSLEDLYANIKVKRYTLARIRRLLLNAVLGIDNSLFLKTPPYIRVLGINDCGEKIIKSCAKVSKIPLILRAKEIENLCQEAQKMFEWENRATDLYSLSLEKPLECGLEYTRGLLKIN